MVGAAPALAIMARLRTPIAHTSTRSTKAITTVQRFMYFLRLGKLQREGSMEVAPPILERNPAACV
jgi:hypothetical protein